MYTTTATVPPWMEDHCTDGILEPRMLRFQTSRAYHSAAHVMLHGSMRVSYHWLGNRITCVGLLFGVKGPFLLTPRNLNNAEPHTLRPHTCRWCWYVMSGGSTPLSEAVSTMGSGWGCASGNIFWTFRGLCGGAACQTSVGLSFESTKPVGLIPACL